MHSVYAYHRPPFFDAGWRLVRTYPTKRDASDGVDRLVEGGWRIDDLDLRPSDAPIPTDRPKTAPAAKRRSNRTTGASTPTHREA